MPRRKEKDPKDVRIKLGKETRDKLDAMYPEHQITNQIRESIEYSYNTKFQGIVDAVAMDRSGGGHENLTFTTEKAKDRVEDVCFLCEHIEFYPYAGYFYMKVKLDDAFGSTKEIMVSKVLETLLTKTWIEKGTYSNEWRLQGSHSSVFSKVYEKPEFNDLFYNINHKPYLEFRKAKDIINTTEEKIIQTLCNPAIIYGIWHRENFLRIIKEKLQEKNGITYEDIINVLKMEAKKGKSYLNECIGDYENLMEKSDTTFNYKEDLTKIKGRILNNLNDHILMNTIDSKAAFLGDIKLTFDAEHQRIRKELTSDLNEINKQLKNLKEYSKNTISVRIKPATFTIID